MSVEEEWLIPHYDANPTNYHTPLNESGAFIEICQTVGVIVEPGDRVLDLGCGDGRLLDHLPAEVLYCGVDYSTERIRAARERYPGRTFVEGDVYLAGRLPFAWADLVVAVEVLEHLEYPDVLVRDLLPRLADGGMIVGTVPKNMPYETHLQVYRTPQDVVEGLVPDMMGSWRNHWTLRWDRPSRM